MQLVFDWSVKEKYAEQKKKKKKKKVEMEVINILQGIVR